MALDTVNQNIKPRLLTGQTALGTNQASAFKLLNNTLHEFTTVSGGSGVVLPLVVLPTEVTVFNAGLNSLEIYPYPGGAINAGSTNAPVSLAAGSAVTYWASSLTNWYNVDSSSGGGGGPGSGTVTSVALVPAHGFSGSVANPTTAPAITISTSVVGLVKGDGTAISAAVPGVDYLLTIPDPSPTTLGGVLSATPVAHEWINSISTLGQPVQSQPNFTDIGGTVSLTQLGDDLITYQKIQNVAPVSLVGNPTGSPALMSNITLGIGLGFAGTTLVATGGGGTVTSVTAGSGLTGGTITTSGTIALAPASPGSPGGIYSVAPIAHEWLNSITTGGVPTLSQPAFSDISGQITTGQIGASQVTYAKIQNEAAFTILGNPTGSGAAPQEVTLGAGLAFAGTVLVATNGGGSVTSVATGAGLTGGTITTSGTVSIAAGGVGTTQLANAGVTYAKIQNEGASSLLGNPTGGAVPPSEITLGTGLVFSGTTLVATGSGGTVTSITAGVGLTGGTITGSGTIALAAPSASTLGGIQSIVPVAHQWINSIATSGVPTLSQPAFTDISGAITTAQVGAGQITYAKLQSEGAVSLLGNPTGSTATPSEITLGAGLAFSGTTLEATATGSVVSIATGTGLTGGPITSSGTISIAAGGVGTTQLAASGVTYAKIQNESPLSLLGNPTGSSVAPSEITLGAGLAFAGTTLTAPGSGGTVTSVGLSVPAWLTVGGSPVTGSGTLAVTATSGESANEFLATPSGSSGPLGVRAIVGADLPDPSSSTLGGIQSIATVTHQFLNGITTSGVPTQAQPAFTDISGTITTGQIGAGQVTYAKLQNESGFTLLGNPTGSSVAPSEITLGPGLVFSGTTLSAPTAPTTQGDFLISGGGVAWVSGYTFLVSAATYSIDGIIYSSAETSVTLATADVTNPRYDLIVVDNTGIVTTVTGTAAPTPILPSADPTTQLALSTIYVPASSSSSPHITTVLLYDEDAGPSTEWTATASAGTLVLNSTTNPFHLSHDVNGTAVAAGTYLQLATSSPIDPTTVTELVFHVRSKATWGAKSLSVAWYSTGVLQGAAVVVKDGSFGFSSSITAAYQQIVIPIGLFALAAGASCNQLRMTVAGGGPTIGFYLDYIQLQFNSDSLPSGYPAMIAPDTLLGNPTSLPAVPSAITLGTGLSIAGSTLNATGGTVTSVATGTGLTGGPITGTGTVSIAAGGVGTTQIAANAVTYAKLQSEGASSLLGNPTGSGAVPSEITLGAGLMFSGTTLAATGSGGTVTSVATGTGLTGGPITGTGTVSVAAGGIGTTQLAASGVTYAKIQSEAASSILGNPTGSPAVPSEITLGSGLSFSGTTLVATGTGGTVTSVATGTGLTGGPITGTGTVSISAGGVGTTQLAANAVTYAKLQSEGASSLLGNPTGSGAVPSEITLGAGLSFSGTTLVAAGSGGTVTTASVATANGFGGTVATATTTPAITITTGVTGLLKGDGTGVSAASAGTDYLATAPTITLTSDVTGSGTGSFATTLATVNSNVGAFGSSTAIPTVTANAKGLVTAVSTSAVIAPAGTLTGTTLNATVVTSSLTSVGVIATGTWQGTAITGTYIASSVALAGSPTTTTQTTGDNSTKIATTAFVAATALATAGLGPTVRPFTAVLGQGVPVTVLVNAAGNYLICSKAGSFVRWDVSAVTGPTTTSLILDVFKSSNQGSTWTSLWATNTGNRPTIAAAANNGGGTSFDTTTYSAGDWLRFDVAQIGSGVAGQNITLVVDSYMNQ